jgi:manganese/zinc-transporting P-type ATPase C
VNDLATYTDPDLQVLSDAAGRIRVRVPWIASSAVRSVAVEESVAKAAGVRAVHAYPRTASVVVWYSPKRCERDEILKSIDAARDIRADLLPVRSPHSADVANADVLRMVIGGLALALLGLRRYAFARPPLLGPTSRLVATGATVFTGYPFLRGALRSLRGGKSVGTDALVSAATIASLVLRENVVALTVLWLLNIGEYLQDLTLRRTRRAIADLLRGTDDTAWVRTADSTEVQVGIDTLLVGDEVVIHDHVARSPSTGPSSTGRPSSTSPRSPERHCRRASPPAPGSMPGRWSSGAGSSCVPVRSDRIPPSAGSSPESKRPSVIGHRSRRSEIISRGASCLHRSCCLP